MDKMTASVTNSAANLRLSSGFAPGPRKSMRQIAAVGPAQLLQALHKDAHEGLFVGIVGGEWYQHADAAHPIRLLRVRHAAAPPSSVMNSRRFTARRLPCFRQKE
jgi:hypothetical protein